MRKAFVPLTVIPGVERRVHPDTLMVISNDKGHPLWNMPAPIRYAEHKTWSRDRRTGERIVKPIMVPIYRGTSASYARWVKAQLKRNQRKAAEKQATADALNEAQKQECDNV